MVPVTVLFLWTGIPLTSSVTSVQDSVTLVRETYGQHHITVINPEDDFEDDETVNEWINAAIKSPDPIEIIVGLNHSAKPYITGGVVLIILPAVKNNQLWIPGSF